MDALGDTLIDVASQEMVWADLGLRAGPQT